MQIAEAALADEYVSHGDRLALQRRVLRLGKPPRRWRRPPWAAAAMSEPQEVCLIAKPLTSAIGAPLSGKRCSCRSCNFAIHACGLHPSQLYSAKQWAALALWLQPGANLVAMGVHSAQDPALCFAGLKSRFLGKDNRECTVEELALQHYASTEGGGWQGEASAISLQAASHKTSLCLCKISHTRMSALPPACCAGTHSEGGIWSTLFGLLMWDLLFTDVPEVVHDPQSLARGPSSWLSPQLSACAFGCRRNPVR